MDDLQAFANAAALLSRLASRLPDGLVLCAGATSDCEDELYPEERERIGRAVRSRRREFATGRKLARQGLSELGFGPAAILAGPANEPLWPPGARGSITHSSGYCAVVVGSAERFRGVGIDLECARAQEPGMAHLIVSPTEPDEYRRSPWLETVFSAKESVFKCVYPDHRQFIDFHDVRIELHRGSSSFRAAPLGAAAGGARVELGSGLFEAGADGVATVFTVSSSASRREHGIRS